MLRGISVIVCSLFLTAVPVVAQQPGMRMQGMDGMSGMMGEQMMMGGMMGQGMMGSGMMQMMGQGMGMMATGGPGPAMILRMEDALDLTDDQVARLEEVQEEFSGSQQQHMNATMSAHQSAREALQGDDPDFDAYQDALQEASTHMVQAHVAMARAAVQARQVLTAEQRERLQQGMGMMQGMMGGGSMQGGDMMRPRGGPR